MSKFRKNLLSFSAVLAVAGLALPSTASAQLFFDWGGGGKELFFDWGGGQEKKVNDSGREYVRINADAKPGDIIVSFSDRRLYLFTQPGLALSYPVAIPREQDRWEGATVVSQKRDNPSWTPTPDMIKENPRLPRWVPGGHPMNPLGVRALYLGSSFYRIHGTDAPWTIGTAVSKGCIRMYNKDALDVYDRTKIGAKVLVTWKNYQFSPASEPIPAIGEVASAGGNVRPTNASLRGGERDQQMSPRRQRAHVEQDDNSPARRAMTAAHQPASSDAQPKAVRHNAATSPAERKPKAKPAASAAVPAAPAVAAPTSPASGGSPSDGDEHSAAPSQNGAAVEEPAERAHAKTAVAPAEAQSAPAAQE